MRHFRNQGVPTAYLAETDKEHQAATGNHDCCLNGVSVGHRREPADDGDDGNGRSHQQHHRHDIPSQQTMKNQGSGIQVERQLGHDADDEHEAGKEDARSPVVAEFQEFRNGIDPGANVIRKQHRASDSEADACGELDRARGEAISIRVSGETDQVFRADIGGKEGRTDQWPAEPPAG